MTLNEKPIWTFIGLEDVRLVDWYDKISMIGVRRDTTTNGEGRMEVTTINENLEEQSRWRIEPPNNSYCEKNWMPVIDQNNTFVKWCNPTEVVEFPSVDMEPGKKGVQSSTVKTTSLRSAA